MLDEKIYVLKTTPMDVIKVPENPEADEYGEVLAWIENKVGERLDSNGRFIITVGSMYDTKNDIFKVHVPGYSPITVEGGKYISMYFDEELNHFELRSYNADEFEKYYEEI